ncbi:MAG: hypothetical protein M1827_005583, partial [Pycnora praestabilis]
EREEQRQQGSNSNESYGDRAQRAWDERHKAKPKVETQAKLNTKDERSAAQAYEVWRDHCDAQLADPKSLTSFPGPPLLPCSDQGCSSYDSKGKCKPVAACQHNVKDFFRGSSELQKALKHAQRQLNPSKAQYNQDHLIDRKSILDRATQLTALINALSDTFLSK